MPRAPRNAEDIDAIRMQILDAAKDIISEQGFNQLSMRKLAATLNMTATNIYNYYSGKDEIYLRVQTAGFTMLQEAFQQAERETTKKTPEQILAAFIRAYIHFGIQQAGYYEVMLGSNTPKYADYVGTELEAVAAEEKQSAMAVAARVINVIRQNNEISHQEALYRTTRAWITLHGLVSLHNNRVLQEIDLPIDSTIQRISAELLSPMQQ